jgi:hypothetical protein
MPHDFETVAEIARRMKRDKAREYGNSDEPGVADLMTFCVVERRGHPIAHVYAGEGPMGARQACYWTAALMRCDVVYLVADSYMRTGPDIDQDLRPGQLQEDWLAGRRTGLSECIVIYRAPAVGQPTMKFYPYARRGRTIKWAQDMGDAQHSEGAIVDNLREGYNDARRVMAEMAPILREAADALELTQPEREYHIDRATLTYISTQGPLMTALLNVVPIEVFVQGEQMPVPDSVNN